MWVVWIFGFIVVPCFSFYWDGAADGVISQTDFGLGAIGCTFTVVGAIMVVSMSKTTCSNALICVVVLGLMALSFFLPMGYAELDLTILSDLMIDKSGDAPDLSGEVDTTLGTEGDTTGTDGDTTPGTETMEELRAKEAAEAAKAADALAAAKLLPAEEGFTISEPDANGKVTVNYVNDGNFANNTRAEIDGEPFTGHSDYTLDKFPDNGDSFRVVTDEAGNLKVVKEIDVNPDNTFETEIARAKGLQNAENVRIGRTPDGLENHRWIGHGTDYTGHSLVQIGETFEIENDTYRLIYDENNPLSSQDDKIRVVRLTIDGEDVKPPTGPTGKRRLAECGPVFSSFKAADVLRQRRRMMRGRMPNRTEVVLKHMLGGAF